MVENPGKSILVGTGRTGLRAYEMNALDHMSAGVMGCRLDAAQGAHVVHVSTTFNHRAGSVRRLYRKARALSVNGFKISLIVGQDFKPAPEWELNGLDLYRIPFLVKYLHPTLDAKAFFHLVGLLRRLKPQVVHTHLAKAGILGRWAAFFCKVPVILHTVHGPTFPENIRSLKRWFYRTAEQWTGRITDHFVFVGEELRQEYVRCAVCDEMNSSTIRTGRPDREIGRLALMTREEKRKIRESIVPDGTEFFIVTVGRIVPSKQQEHAVRILAELRKEKVKAGLVVVGEANLKEEMGYVEFLKSLSSDLKVSGYVRFLGHREDVLDIMASADALLHTSKYEGLPNVLVEAALCSRPVVSYLVSGAGEVVQDGVTGFIISQGDIAEATRKLLFLAQHPEVAHRMGHAANEALLDDYCESAMIKNTINFHEEVVVPLCSNSARRASLRGRLENIRRNLKGAQRAYLP
jgi:glycosyltransferase involved in cell wall biosynthesis